MESGELMQLGLMALAALAVGVVGFILVYPHLSGEAKTGKRIQSVTESRQTKTARNSEQQAAQSRRKQVQDTLKEIEDRQKAREKITLRLRLQRAGLDVSTNAFWIASGIVGFVLGVGVFISMPNASPLVPLLAAFAGALGLPRWILNFITKRRQGKFVDEFANSIDVIVRGVKSGLPLNECLQIIARESPEPISSEFTEVVEQQRVGVTLQEAFERMMLRMPLPEVKFFGIVVGISQQAGGNLSEALGNLAGVLRDRKRMAAKVKALSAEAKASAMVLGSLPFIVMTMVYITTPHYIALLWTTKVGQMLLIAAGIWMSIGLLTMRKMINFKY